MLHFKPSTLSNARFRGEDIHLIPFHRSHIADVVNAADDIRIWEHHPENRTNRLAHQRFLLNVLDEIANGNQMAWVVVNSKTDELMGFVRFFSPNESRCTWEMGTWIIPTYWGTGINKQLKDTLLTAAFLHHQIEKVIFRTDATNVRSQKAIQQLGAICTDVLLNERVTWKGLSRDAYYYELTPELWLSKKLRKMFGTEPSVVAPSVEVPYLQQSLIV